MEPERWKTIETVVAAALELPAEEREAYFEEACGGDEELRAEVEGLLAGQSGAEDFLESPAVTPAGDTESAEDDPLIGSDIGAYRIEGLLGSGGMGAVYLASRADEEFEQRVAVKLLHAGPAGESIRSRFRTERQILAALDHPHIARLLDGGSIPDGRPFLVMEYVEGVPLDDYCAKQGLDVRQRIELFLQVCEAVSFAHRNLVVHRDLKPSNILVTEQGRAKLLDFGIAKLLDPAAYPMAGEATQTGLRPMSPHFASPEQIRGQPITTASDGYSLGVVLYELLTGELPRRFEDYSLAAMERELGREPTAPSVIAGEEADAARIRRQLAGDLDAIVLKALREEPEQRYASVDELAEDLSRHMEGLPVTARHGTFAYRAGRFLRRHKVAVSVTALVAALVIGSAIALGLQARRIATERDKARKIANFMSDLFHASAPMETGGRELTVREVLDDGTERARTELGNQPELQAPLLTALGQSYFQLGMYDTAESLLLESLELCDRASIPAEPVIAATLNQLAAISLDGDELDKTQALVERALELGRQGIPGDPYALPDSLTLMGDVLHERGEDERAVEYYREALEIARKTHGENVPYYAYRLIYLAAGLRRTGSTEAEALYLRALEIQRSTLAPEDPLVMLTLMSLGDYYLNRQQLGDALEVLEEALPIGEKGLGPDHPEVAGAHQRLARTYLDRGELATAEAHASRSLAILEQHRSAGSPAVVRSQQIIADVAGARGELGAARELLAQVLAAHIANLGPENWRVAVAEQKIALLEHFGGDHEAARRRMEEAIATLETNLPAGNPTLAEGLARAAAIHLDTPVAPEAEEPLRRAMAIWQAKGFEGSARYARSGVHLAQALLAAGRVDEAEGPLEEAFGILEELLASDPCPSYRELNAEAQLAAGRLHAARGDDAAARRAWAAALRSLESTPEENVGAEHHRVAAAALLELGRVHEARPHALYLIERGWRWPAFLDGFRASE